MQNKPPALFKPVAAGQDGDPNGTARQETEGAAQAGNAATQNPEGGPPEADLGAIPQLGRQDAGRPYQPPNSENTRMLGDGMTLQEGIAPLHFTALHNPIPAHNALPVPMPVQHQPIVPPDAMPFQALLQADPAQLGSQQFEAAARRIAWDNIGQNNAPGIAPLGLTDRADPAWKVWEERFQYYKSHGIGNRTRRERMVYSRPMPHARRSTGPITEEDEEADRQSLKVMDWYLRQKFQQLKDYNLLP